MRTVLGMILNPCLIALQTFQMRYKRCCIANLGYDTENVSINFSFLRVERVLQMFIRVLRKGLMVGCVVGVCVRRASPLYIAVLACAEVEEVLCWLGWFLFCVWRGMWWFDIFCGLKYRTYTEMRFDLFRKGSDAEIAWLWDRLWQSL